MKRFYRAVAIRREEGQGHLALLDGRPILTPARHPLLMPSAAVAELVAEEWRRQGEEVVPDTMPATRPATTVVDLMPGRRQDAIGEVVGYAETDLLCYRAAAPRALASREEAAWQPWLDWAERELDARLAVGRSIEPVAQSEASLRALRLAVAGLDDWRLVGLHAATTLMGSVVLGLAMARGRLDAATGFRVALLDELFEIEQWGEEAEQQRRHARLRRDLEAAERFLRSLAA
jgi:chaperone required for assembly of F1-ATPase